MTRDDLKKIFGEGITDEQITQILNQHNSEVATEKGKAAKLSADAKKAKELQDKLDEINQQNMSDLEKAQADVKTANDNVAKLEAQIRELKFRNSLSDKGITGEDADHVVEAFMAGDFEKATESIGQIISNREKSAVADYEKKLMQSTPDPGGAGGDGKDTEPEDVRTAKLLNFGVTDNEAQKAQDFYK